MDALELAKELLECCDKHTDSSADAVAALSIASTVVGARILQLSAQRPSAECEAHLATAGEP